MIGAAAVIMVRASLREIVLVVAIVIVIKRTRDKSG